uniref:Uncharacterized protein n=1 Tax=Rhizophora mucronata TaxID=61149 RepID=A0A2P2QCJ7_RHIMU
MKLKTKFYNLGNRSMNNLIY